MAINSKVVYVEPNYTITKDGEPLDEYFRKDDEDYCIYVDLQVEIYTRNEGFGTSGAKTLLLSWKSTQSGNDSVSFMQGQHYKFYNVGSPLEEMNIMTTDYVNTHYMDVVNHPTNETFGIESIDIQYNNRFVPEVTIKFKDIKGASLFAPEELRHSRTSAGVPGCAEDDIAGSFFKCFFTFPWPRFTLMVKGFYGQAVSYELTCHDFKASFESSTGNFGATASFIGYDYSFLNDISFNAIIAAPNSPYLGAEYWEQNKSRFKKIDSNGVEVEGLPKISDIIKDIKSWTSRVEEVQNTEGQVVIDKTQIMTELQLIQSEYAKVMSNLENIIFKLNEKKNKTEKDLFYGCIENKNYGFAIISDQSANSLRDLTEYAAYLSCTEQFGKINEKIDEFNGKNYGFFINKIEEYPLYEKVVPFYLFDNDRSSQIKYRKNLTKLNNFVKKLENVKCPCKIRTKIDTFVTIWNENELQKRNSAIVNNTNHDFNAAIAWNSYKCYLFDNFEFVFSLEKVIEDVNLGLQSSKSKLNATLKKIEIGGENSLIPSIENITRVLMAHLETYIYMVSKSAELVGKQTPKRTIKTLGLTSANTTLSNAELECGAWPDIKIPRKVSNYENDAPSMEDGWIGDLLHGDETPEYKLIEGLVAATKEMSDDLVRARNALNSIPSSDTETLSGENTQETNNEHFAVEYPLTIADMLVDGNVFGLNSLNETHPQDLYARLFIRMMNLFKFSYQGIYDKDSWYKNAKAFGKIDAENFKKQFGYNKVYKQLKTVNDAKRLLDEMTFKITYNFFYRSPNDNRATPLLTENGRNYHLNEKFFKYSFPLVNLTLSSAMGINGELTNGKPTLDRCNNFIISPTLQELGNSYENSGKIVMGQDLLRFSRLCKNNELHTELMKNLYGDLLDFGQSGKVLDITKPSIALNVKIPESTYNDITEEAKFKGNHHEHILPKKRELLNNLGNFWYRAVDEEKQDTSDRIYYSKADGNMYHYDREINGFANTVSVANSLNPTSCENLTIPTFPVYVEDRDVDQSFFLSSEYSVCKTIQGRAFCFLLGLYMSMRKIKNLERLEKFRFNKVISRLELAFYGGFYFLKKQFVRNNGVASDADLYDDFTYIKSTVLKKKGANDDMYLWSFIPEIRKDLEEKIIAEFISFARNEGDNKGLYAQIESKFAIIPPGTRDIMIKLDEIRYALSYGNSKPKPAISYNEENLARKLIVETNKLPNSFFENYLTFDNKGRLFNRQDCAEIKELVEYIFTPCVVFALSYSSDTELDTRGRRNPIFLCDETITSSDITAFDNYYQSFIGELMSMAEEFPTPQEEQTEDISEDNQSESEVAANEKTAKHIKIALYKYTEYLFNRWFGSQSEMFNQRWKFEDGMRRFHFLDCYYNKIGNQCMINMEDFVNTVVESEMDKKDEAYFSLSAFMTHIFSKSNVNMMCVQNFIDLGSSNGDTKSQWIENMQKMFEPIPYLKMNFPENAPQFICMYYSEPSKHLDIIGGEYKNDSFMLNDENNYPMPINNKTDTNGYPIPAFGVSYGGQYQSYFKDVNVDMSKAVMTEQSLKAQFIIAGAVNPHKSEGEREVYALGQDLYTIYSNNSYTCTVNMLGCAWVQPLMYFCLLNVPLFRGSYLITKVNHSIRPGFMETSITGVRMAQTSVPFVDTPLLEVNGGNSDVPSYYDENEEGYIEDDGTRCGYQKFPVVVHEYVEAQAMDEYGFDKNYLNKTLKELGVDDDCGLKTKLGLNRETTLLDGLSAIACLEASVNPENQGAIGTKLVIATLFNRCKKVVSTKNLTYKNAIFKDSQFQVWHRQSIGALDINAFNTAKEWVQQIFQSSPSILVGNIIEAPPMNGGTETGGFPYGMVKNAYGGGKTNMRNGMPLTLNMLQRLYFFIASEAYRVGFDHFGTSDVFAFQYWNHVYHYIDNETLLWGNKKDEEKTKKTVEEPKEGELSELEKGFVQALQKTIESTHRYESKISATPLDSKTITIVSSHPNEHDIIFDMIANAYEENVKNLWWIGKDNNAVTDEKPIEIRVELCEETDASSKTINCSWKDAISNNIESATDIDTTVPSNVLKSALKRYNSTDPVNLIKKEVTFLGKKSDDDIKKLVDELSSESCPIPSVTTKKNGKKSKKTAPYYIGSDDFEIPLEAKNLKNERMKKVLSKINKYCLNKEYGNAKNWKDVTPKYIKGVNGKCVRSVRTWYHEGGINIQPWTNNPSTVTYSTTKMYDVNNHNDKFELVWHGTLSEYKLLEKNQSSFFRLGDVATMYVVKSSGKKSAHICMFCGRTPNGGLDWRSDFKQTSAWVYPNGKGRDGNYSVCIWRHPDFQEP